MASVVLCSLKQNSCRQSSHAHTASGPTEKFSENKMVSLLLCKKVGKELLYTTSQLLEAAHAMTLQNNPCRCLRMQEARQHFRFHNLVFQRQNCYSKCWRMRKLKLGGCGVVVRRLSTRGVLLRRLLRVPSALCRSTSAGCGVSCVVFPREVLPRRLLRVALSTLPQHKCRLLSRRLVALLRRASVGEPG